MTDFKLTGKTRKWFKRLPRKLKKYYKKKNIPYPNVVRFNTDIHNNTYKVHANTLVQRSLYFSPPNKSDNSTIITNTYSIFVDKPVKGKNIVINNQFNNSHANQKKSN